MPYIICATRATTHIQGIPERTTGPATDNSATTGVVGYYANSACSALTRSAHRMNILTANADLTAALEDARASCEATGRKLCKNCERAALRAIEDAKNAAPAAPAAPTYATALAALPAGTDVQLYTSSGETITGTIAGTGTDGAMVAAFITGRRRQVAYDTVESFEFFDHDAADGDGAWVDPIADAEPTEHERQRAYELAYREAKYTADRAAAVTDDAADAAAEAAYERYRDAADAIDRCLIFGCENTTDPYRAYCPEHDLRDDIEDDDTACGERTTVDGIGYPCIKRGEHVEHNTRLGAAWWTATVHGDGEGTPLPAYDDARKAYMVAADRFEETGAAADRLAADDAWGTFLAAAAAAGKCTVFTCYADAEPGETTCVRHGAEAAAAAALAAREDADRAAMASDALAAADAEAPSFAPIASNPNCSCTFGQCEDCAREYRAKLDAIAQRHRPINARIGGGDFIVCAACSKLVKLVAPDHPGVTYPCEDAKLLKS
jgi:hypothetical protein